MNKWLERTIWFFFVLIMSAISFTTARYNTNKTIDSAQGTSAALQNSLNELLSVTQPPDFSFEVERMATKIQVLEGGIESYQNTLIAISENTYTPTPTPNFTQTAAPFYTAIAPTITSTQIENCYPHNIIEVVVTRIPHLDLWDTTLEYHFTDNNGNRVRYFVGETFFVYEEIVETDDGDRFYKVFGPRGWGLYTSEGSIKLYNRNPDLAYCNQ